MVVDRVSIIFSKIYPDLIKYSGMPKSECLKSELRRNPNIWQFRFWHKARCFGKNFFISNGLHLFGFWHFKMSGIQTKVEHPKSELVWISVLHCSWNKQ